MSPLTRMILTNVIYFDGKWLFELENFGAGEFRGNRGTKQVQYMKLIKKLKYGVTKNQEAEWVELPYKSRSDSMIIIKPHSRSQGRAETLINTMPWSTVQEVIDNASRENYANVTLKMPKVTLKTTAALIQPLKEV